MATVAAAPRATIGQRLDRLPLTWTLWRLGLVTQVAWAFALLSDGIAARIYPFVWGPQNAFDLAHFSWLLVISTGAGIVVGEYAFAVLSDQLGRRSILIAAAVTCGLGTVVAAFTSNFYVLAVGLGLGAAGIGGVLATNIVYMAEVAPKEVRGRMTQTTQAVAPMLLNVLGNLSALILMPQHYELLVVLIAAGPLVVVVPLVAVLLPESPRWLEAHGHGQEADAVTSRLERESQARAGSLREPAIGEVVAEPKAGVRDLFGPRFRGRTVLLLVCWILGYSGLVYGPLGFINLYFVKVGFSAQTIFTAGLIASIFGAGAGLFIAGRLNERFERKDVILAGAVVASIGLVLTFITGSFLHSLPALAISSSVVTAGLYLWLFNMYTYTAVAYPTRIRAVGTGWTDGFGHIGAMISPLIIGPLFVATANAGYIGYFAYVIIPGALLPAVLLSRYGVSQRAASLESVAAV